MSVFMNVTLSFLHLILYFFFRYWYDKESAKLVDQRIQKGLFLFASTNSCMNPIVYGVFNIRAKGEKQKQHSTIACDSSIKLTSLSFALPLHESCNPSLPLST